MPGRCRVPTPMKCRSANSAASWSEGREWNTVRIAHDFTPPKDADEHNADGQPMPGPIDETEARLAYVAVTRARTRLDIGGLSWINDRPDALAAAS